MMLDTKEQVRVEDDVAVSTIQLALVLLFQFNQNEIVASELNAPDLEYKQNGDCQSIKRKEFLNKTIHFFNIPKDKRLKKKKANCEI